MRFHSEFQMQGGGNDPIGSRERTFELFSMGRQTCPRQVGGMRGVCSVCDYLKCFVLIRYNDCRWVNLSVSLEAKVFMLESEDCYFY